MADQWYRHFGWGENPFKIQPDPEHIMGFVDIRSKITSYIESHDPFLIIGPTGAGKTTLLLWVRDREDDDVRYIYHNFLEEESDRKLRDKIKGGWFSFLDRRPVVALLDEVQEMRQETARYLRGKFDHGEIQSLAMASIEEELTNLEGPFLSRIGDRKIRIRNLKEREAFQMVRQRVFDHGERNPFSEDALRIAFDHAGYSPRKILEACERLCIEAARKEKDRIDADFTTMVLKPQEPTKEGVKRAVESPSTGEIKRLVHDKLRRIMESDREVEEVEREMEEGGESLEERLGEIETEMEEGPSPTEEEEGGEEKEGDRGRFDDLLSSLSPTQQEIARVLRDNDMSTKEIAEEVGISRASAAKQLSRLSLSTDEDILESKGIEEPVVIKKEEGRPVIYGLNPRYLD